MEMAPNMNAVAFAPLAFDEMMEIDGGASRFAVAVVNIGCSIIASAVCGGVGAAIGVAIGGGVPGAIVGGIIGLVGGAVVCYFMTDAITSKW